MNAEQKIKNNIIIPVTEYNYLKNLEKSFEKLFSSFGYFEKIADSRKQIKTRKYVSQEVLFRKLGI